MIANSAATPTVPPPQPRSLSGALTRNIEALAERRLQEEAAATRQQKIAHAIGGFAGSMLFVYLHIVFFGSWILAGSGVVPGIEDFDPSFNLLGMVSSVEAIFLSTFVLITQNRTAAASDKRADLDLQVSLLAEHELTKVAEMVAAIAQRLDVRTGVDAEVAEITRDVAPEAVLDEMEAHEPEQE